MYAYKEKYTLDFSKIEHWGDFHQIIKKELDLPFNYGKNWDALWDCLTDIVNNDKVFYVEILGAEVLEQKWPGTLDNLVEILKDLKHLDNDEYYNTIKIEIVCGEARYEIH